jgi:hypothetical protein
LHEGDRLIAPLFEVERVTKLAGDTAEQRLEGEWSTASLSSRSRGRGSTRARQ